jgi:hypothetical protein
METSRQAVIQAARRLVEIQRASAERHISPAIKEQAEVELMQAIEAMDREEDR